METIRKLIYPAIFILPLLLTLPSCNNDSSQWCCEILTGETRSNELGRVYYRNVPGDSFYYIGDPDTTKRFGGYLPCNSLPESLIPDGEIGVLVTFSGAIKTSEDAEEPAYFGIELTSVQKATQETF